MKKSKVRQPTPQQALYIKYYADPKSETFGSERIEYESNVQAIFYLVQVPVKPPVQAILSY